MAQSSFPFENADTTETQYSWLFRNFSALPGGGVQGVPGDTTLKVTPGTGLTTSIAAGQAMVRGHYYSNTAAVVLTHDASTSQGRIDSIVLELDPTANQIVAKIVKGTAGASPVAPTLSQTDSGVYQFKLADVTIQASAIAIASGDINDQRAFLKNVWTSNTRPTGTLGLFGWNTTLGTIEGYNGTAWVSVNPTSLDASVITSGTVDANRLPNISVAKGGTGATDAATARTNLGVTPGNIGAAATSHNHIIGDVTGLQAALDGKQPAGSYQPAGNYQPAGSYAAASHTHDASNIVSGSLDLPGSVAGVGINVKNGVGGYAVTMASNGNVAVGGTLNVTSALGVAGNIYDSTTYNTANSGRALYVQSDGLFGVGGSSERFKENIVDANLDPAAILKIAVRNYNYKADFSSDQSLQIGVIAEELVKLGLTQFVYFDEDKKPSGVAYEKLALAALIALQAQAEQISSIEARLAKLEK